MPKYNYLVEADKCISKKILDCGISRNFDEYYIQLYPKLSRKLILTLSANLPKSDYKEITDKIKLKFGLQNILLGSGCEDLIIRATIR